MFHSCELKDDSNDPSYQRDAMHVYTTEEHCSIWNFERLNVLDGQLYTCIMIDGCKDEHTNLENVPFLSNLCKIGNLLCQCMI